MELEADNPNIFNPTPSITPDSILNHVGKSGIQASVDSAINNTDFVDSFTDSLKGAIANDIGAITANAIGDLGEHYDLANGGVTKVTLHAVSQGAVAELAGGDFAAAGAVTELTGELVGNSGLDEGKQVEESGFIGAGAGVIATGDAGGVYGRFSSHPSPKRRTILNSRDRSSRSNLLQE